MVRHLLRAGAIPIGRTNLPDLGLRYHTDSSVWGPTVNPWDKNLTPGGSSGGDAVAVATGMTPLGFGNDYGGSLRFPAQCCGVAAFKPSLGRVAHALEALPNSQFPISFQWFSAQGPIARSVDDLAYVWPIISQSDPRDPGWTPARLKASGSRPRVAVLEDPGGLGVDPDIAKSVLTAGETLKSLGYQVDVIQGESVIEGLRLWNQIVAADLVAGHLNFIREHASKAANQFVSYLIANVEPPNLNQYVNALARRNALSRSWREFNQRYPLVLGPVSTAPPFAVGFDVSSQQNASAMLQSMRLTVTINLLGLPSVTVPVGLDKTPQVVQIIGPMHGDELCLATAQLLQSAVGFKAHPPGWG